MPFDQVLLIEYLKEKMYYTDPDNPAYADILHFCEIMEKEDQYHEMQKKYRQGWRPGKGYPKEKL